VEAGDSQSVGTIRLVEEPEFTFCGGFSASFHEAID
jgi:hypothetical protein